MIGRYELKFPLVTAEIKQQFLEAAGNSLKPDPHGRDAIYRVSSQYFDDKNYSAYWEKIDGEAVRKKFRLRYYNLESEESNVLSAFMEIKHRIDNRVFKERLKLTPRGAEKILSDSNQLIHITDHIESSEKTKINTLDNIVRAIGQPGFKAVNVITYIREAWIGDVDNGLRVTFDSSCRALVPQAYLDVSSQSGEPIVSEDKIVMEIKFNHAIPRWIRDLVGKMGIDLKRFSKYASGLEALNIVKV